MPLTFDRRRFLAGAGAAAAAGTVLPTGFSMFSGMAAPAFAYDEFAAPIPDGQPIVVYLDLRGGNDGLNMLAPVDNGWYRQERPTLALTEATGLALNGVTRRLHPSMPWLANRWNTAGDVAFVEGVGENVRHDFSHFASMNYRNWANFSGAGGTGWLGRLNDSLHPTPGPMVATSLSGLHPALVGSTGHVLFLDDVANFGVRQDWRVDPWNAPGGFEAAWIAMGSDPTAAGARRAASSMITQTFAVRDLVEPAADETVTEGVAGNSLAWQMAQAGLLIRAGMPCQTYVCAMGGFDTHEGQAPDHQALLAELDAGLQKFFSIIDGTNRADDVVLVMQSEFGRQVIENGSAGTDHGQAGVVLAVGGPVSGGLYGQLPSLVPADRLYDAMVPTVDFRQVYSTVLNYLGNDSNLTQSVLGGSFAPLGFLS